MSAIQRPLTLLGLPTEIRLKIWKHLYHREHYTKHADDIWVHMSCSTNRSWYSDSPKAYGLERDCDCEDVFSPNLVCREFYAEIGDVVRFNGS